MPAIVSTCPNCAVGNHPSKRISTCLSAAIQYHKNMTFKRPNTVIDNAYPDSQEERFNFSATTSRESYISRV